MVNEQFAAESARVQEALHQARIRISAAHGLVPELHIGVAHASAELSHAERAHWVGATSHAGDNPVVASDALEQVQKLCGTSHAIGAEIQLKLDGAYVLVEDARQALRRIDPETLSGQERSDLAALGVRVDALSDVVDLGRSMTEAAMGHLGSASQSAGQMLPLEHPQGQPHAISRVAAQINLASSDLGQATADTRHLGRTVEQADVGGQRAARQSDVVSEAARRRLGHESRRGSAPAAAGAQPHFFGPSR